jgi:hypothetical protein
MSMCVIMPVQASLAQASDSAAAQMAADALKLADNLAEILCNRLAEGFAADLSNPAAACAHSEAADVRAAAGGDAADAEAVTPVADGSSAGGNVSASSADGSAAPEASAVRAIFTGPSIFVAAALAGEEAYWLALCLQVSR